MEQGEQTRHCKAFVVKVNRVDPAVVRGRIAVAPKALDTFKQGIRLITSRVGGKGMAQIAEQLQAYLPGWKSYFRLAQTPRIFKNLDSWTRHRLRAI